MLKTIQKGFTLIELMLVLGIATIMSIAAMQATKRDGEQQIGNAAATQMNELGTALTKQISRNYATYSAAPRTTVSIADLQASGLLPAFYQNITPFGGIINMEAVSTGGATPSVTGLITTTPWTDGVGNPRYDLLGATIKKIGAQGGVSYYSATTVSGLNGIWSAVQGVNPSEFTFITAPGQLATRIYVDAAGQDGVYLRRDGLLPMLGNLDLGFHDINNAVNISANGWVYANHLAANDATLGSVFSNYIRNTGGIDTAQITGIGSSSIANFEYLTARTRITAGKLLLNEVVGEGTPCSPDGLVAKNSNGTILSCESGGWRRFVKATGDTMTGSLYVTAQDLWAFLGYGAGYSATAAIQNPTGSAYLNDVYLRSIGRWGSQIYGGSFVTYRPSGACIWGNSYTGACSCPPGTGAHQVGQLFVWAPWDGNGFVCH